MKTAIDWFARNSVAANLLMFLIMVSGVLTAFNLKQEVFPEFALDIITVQVPYLGAAPEEVEEGVSVRVEEAIQGVDGIKRLTSTSAEGMGTVVVELELGVDASRVLDEVKARVDAIDTFPDETEKPIITEVTNRRQAINIAISGETDEPALKRLGERIRDEVAALPGITLVELTNARPYEISIEVSEGKLRRHGLTFDQVSTAVRQSSLDLPGGSLKTVGGEILLRTKGQAYRGGEFEELTLLSRRDGTLVKLGDVATVVDGFAETDQYARFDGKPSVFVEVFRTGDQAVLDIAAQVHGYVERAQSRMPEGVQLTIWQDQSKTLNDRIGLLVRNGLSGLVLLCILLVMFLKPRLSFWVSLGIPISFLGAMWLMPVNDVSINLMSLFAFIVVLGIVVDDAIVVGENIYSHQTRETDDSDEAHIAASVRGALEVAVPVTFGVLTTIAAFAPLLGVPGTIGKIMRIIPLIVIPCLLISLVESMFILPAHLAHSKKEKKTPRGFGRIQAFFSDGLVRFVTRFYVPFLEKALHFRLVTIATALAILFVSLSLVVSGRIRFDFFPSVEADYISAALTMPQGTPVEATAAAVLQIEQRARALNAELENEYGEPLFRHISASIGDQPYQTAQNFTQGNVATRVSSAHLGEVTIELVPAEIRGQISSDILAQRWRQATGPVLGAVELRFSASLFSPGDDVDLQLTGPDLDELTSVANQLKAKLREYNGVSQVSDSFREGKRELKLDIKPEAELLGLTLNDLARQVRQAFYGDEAQRIQRGRDDVRVMVRYPKHERSSLGYLENMRIRTPAGEAVAFSQVAELVEGRGFSAISRVDRRRAVNVRADADAKVVATADVLADIEASIMPEILAAHPNVFYSFEGQSAEQRDSFGGLLRGFLVALLIIYTLLAIPLKSYTQPLIIMTAIPFGLVGAIWGHLALGYNLTILSGFGLVALTGVVVNDSLVLVDFINRKRREGASIFDAILEAGRSRFRPVLLTSMTTFVGLLPLLLEKSVQASFLIPMAISLAFGVLVATGISLILVPSTYLFLGDIQDFFGGQRVRADQLGARQIRDIGPQPTGVSAFAKR